MKTSRSPSVFLRRYRLILVSSLLIAVAGAMVVGAVLPNLYKASTLILIEPQEGQDDTFLLVLRAKERLQSPALAYRVIHDLGLMSDPEFNPRFRNTKKTNDNKTSSFKSLNVHGKSLGGEPSDLVDAQAQDVVQNFLKHLHISAQPGSSALSVEFLSLSPSRAALVANALVQNYITLRLEDYSQEHQKYTKWLSQKLLKLEQEISSEEDALRMYKQEHDLSEGALGLLSEEYLSALNERLAEAQAQKAQVKAELKQLLGKHNRAEKVKFAPAITGSPFLSYLRKEEESQKRSLVVLSNRYGEKHPKIIEAQAALSFIKKTIHAETVKAERELEEKVSKLEKKIDFLKEELDQSSQTHFENAPVFIKIYDFEHRIEALRSIYETFLAAQKNIDHRSEFQKTGLHIISYAHIPVRPTYPDRKSIMLWALGLAFAGATLLIFWREVFDKSFRDSFSLEKAFNLPCFALVPSCTERSPKERAHSILKNPSSPLAESVRTLRSALNLRTGSFGKKPKVITVTSSSPGEGKTTLSLWLGRQAAKAGEKVIVIDADLRRSNIHKTLEKKNDASLVEYLSDQKELDEVIQKDEASGLHIIYGRNVPNTALDLLSSEKMKKLVSSLAQIYDLVILDGPAALAVSDARVLSALSDHTLYAVSWNRTPHDMVEAGIRPFTDIHCKSLSFVMTNVDVQRQVRYGLGESIYEYGHYKTA